MLPPRPRPSPTRPAQPHHRPTHLEHESTRAGALNLLAACASRSGQVDGQGYDRTRQAAGIAFLEHLDQEMAEPIRTIHRVCDHVRPYHGQDVSRWLANHPRLVVHCTPVHCAWMNHVEHGFSILQRKRLRMVDFSTKDHLRRTLAQGIEAWKPQAHPLNWSATSVAQEMAEAPAMTA